MGGVHDTSEPRDPEIVSAALLAYCSEDHGSGPTWNQWLEACSLSTQQQMGTRWKH